MGEVRRTCAGCQDGAALGFDFSMAFQPIVDIRDRSVWGYEALVRGLEGQSAWSILSQVNEANRYRFDQACRVKAIETAGRLFGASKARLSINFLPNAVYEPAACIRTSLAAADSVGFSRDQIMFEFTEDEKMEDVGHVAHIISEYRRFGFLTAIDDFGAGYSGLNLLAKFRPDLIKLDMELIRNLDTDRARRTIVTGVASIARDLGVDVIAEGVESHAEAASLREIGINLLQGYYFARPSLGSLPQVTFEIERAA